MKRVLRGGRGTLIRVVLVSLLALGAFGAGRLTHSNTGVLDEAEASISQYSNKGATSDLLRRAAIEGMLRASGDRWSSYYGVKEVGAFDQSLAGRYTGVGLWLRTGKGGGVEVASVMGSSPAEKAGVLAGDSIVTAQGVDVSSSSVPVVSALLRGDANSQVQVTVVRSGESIDFTLPRFTVASNDVTADSLKNGVLVIRISAFTRGVGSEVSDILAKSAHQGGVVLDLRDNPGGLIEEAVAVVGAFVSGGVVVSFERRGQESVVLDAAEGSKEHGSLAVVVNAQSASASEIVAAALQDRNRAVIVGIKTFGKGTVQEPQLLSDGSSIQLSVGRYRTPSGRYLEGAGVQPDVISPSSKSIARAVSIVTSLNTIAGPGGKG
jgi:carboxyl-terminal processing protease